LEKEKKEKIDWPGADSFDLLFRIRGKKGLFNKRKKMHRQGIVPMVMFGDVSKTCVVNEKSLVPLSSHVFITYAGHENLKMKDVFHNLNEYFKTTNSIPKIYDLMKIMVPEFDEDHFFESDAERVFAWYLQWIGVIDKIFKEHAKGN
jgi:hypothetical protein